MEGETSDKCFHSLGCNTEVVLQTCLLLHPLLIVSTAVQQCKDNTHSTLRHLRSSLGDYSNTQHERV